MVETITIPKNGNYIFTLSASGSSWWCAYISVDGNKIVNGAEGCATVYCTTGQTVTIKAGAGKKRTTSEPGDWSSYYEEMYSGSVNAAFSVLFPD